MRHRQPVCVGAQMQIISRLLVIAGALIPLIHPVEARAESFSELTAKGATVGKMTRNPAGLSGWVVTSNGKTYFCKWNVSIAIVDAKTLVAFTSSGRMVKLDRGLRKIDWRTGQVDAKARGFEERSPASVGCRAVPFDRQMNVPSRIR